MKFTLKQLQAFIATAETYSITKAAHLMDISPPAISKHIRNLEAICESSLFSLSGKTLYLTNFGEQLYALVKPFIHSAEALEHNMLKIQQSEAPSIKVTVTGTILAIVSKKIEAFRKIYPHINFELSTVVWSEQMDKLNQGLSDIYILNEPKTILKRIPYEKVGAYELTMVAAKGHAFEGKSVSEEQLCDTTFLACDDDSASQQFQNTFLKSINYKLKPLTLNSSGAAKECVMADVGIAILPELIVRDEVEQGRLVKLQYEFKSPSFDIVMAHTRELSEPMQLFYNYMLKNPF